VTGSIRLISSNAKSGVDFTIDHSGKWPGARSLRYPPPVASSPLADYNAFVSFSPLCQVEGFVPKPRLARVPSQ
jgi:hypothetical protein